VKYLIHLFLLALVIGLFFGLGCGKNVQIPTPMPTPEPNIQISAGELKVSGYSFTINPCKFTYQEYGTETVNTSIKNLTSSTAKFSVGNDIITVPSNSSVGYEAQLNLVGQTERIRIIKISEGQVGLAIQEALVLKIEPRTKGK